MDPFIATTPFFSAEHRALAERVADFAEREIEVRAGDTKVTLTKRCAAMWRCFRKMIC